MWLSTSAVCRSAELLLLLDPATDFPSAAFAPVLATLQQLGMKSVAEPGTVLHSARSIEAMAAEQPEQGEVAGSRACVDAGRAHYQRRA